MKRTILEYRYPDALLWLPADDVYRSKRAARDAAKVLRAEGFEVRVMDAMEEPSR